MTAVFIKDPASVPAEPFISSSQWVARKPLEDLFLETLENAQLLQRSAGPAGTSLPERLPPVKHPSRNVQNGSDKWESRDKSKLGSPIRTSPLNAARWSGLLSDRHPLDGNKNFKIIQSLTPGASSSVLLCQDVRDQVSLQAAHGHTADCNAEIVRAIYWSRTLHGAAVCEFVRCESGLEDETCPYLKTDVGFALMS